MRLRVKKYLRTLKMKSQILSQYDEVDEIKEMYNPPMIPYYEYDEIKTAVQDLSRMGCLRIEQITDPHDGADLYLTFDNRRGGDMRVEFKEYNIGAKITEKGMRYREFPMKIVFVIIALSSA